MAKCPTTKMSRKVFEFGTLDSGPGPAAYSVQTTVGRKNRMPNITNEPAYTMKQRFDSRNETESPGPVYNLEGMTCRGKASMSKFSIGMRLDQNDESDNPGPAAYMPGAVRSTGLKILLPLKTLDPRVNNPGPNAYKLPSMLSRKGVTLAKIIEEVSFADSPGPAGYHTVPLDKYKRRAPNFSLAKKFEEPLLAAKINELVPGPQAYNSTLKYKYNRVPKFAFGTRRPDKFPPLVVCGDEVKKRK